jgi:hypothetical protein
MNGQGLGVAALKGSGTTVTWANRNRINETAQILGWSTATVAPEAGQTTTVEVLDGGGAVLRSFAGLTGTSYALAAADAAGGAALRVSSQRGSYRSLQAFVLAYTP